MAYEGDVTQKVNFPFLLFQTLKKNFADLQKSLDELTRLSVATVIRKMLDYAARPLSDFNKYEAIDIHS